MISIDDLCLWFKWTFDASTACLGKEMFAQKILWPQSHDYKTKVNFPHQQRNCAKVFQNKLIITFAHSKLGFEQQNKIQKSKLCIGKVFLIWIVGLMNRPNNKSAIISASSQKIAVFSKSAFL